MDIGNIAKLIKNLIWLIIGIIVLPVGIVVLWLLIMLLISVNISDGTMLSYIITYLVICFGMMITTGLSLWVGKLVKNILTLTRLKDKVEKYLQKQLEKFELQEKLKKTTK